MYIEYCKRKLTLCYILYNLRMQLTNYSTMKQLDFFTKFRKLFNMNNIYISSENVNNNNSTPKALKDFSFKTKHFFFQKNLQMMNDNSLHEKQYLLNIQFITIHRFKSDLFYKLKFPIIHS